MDEERPPLNQHPDHERDTDSPPTAHSHLSDIERRVRALETVLTQKGYVDPAALDVYIDTYEHRIGPRNGARVVARAWVDPAYRARCSRSSE